MNQLPMCCPPAPKATLTEQQANQLASVLKALSDPVRLRLVSMLSQVDERCACDLVEPLGVSQPTVSHHLKVLTDAGVLDRRKEGRWMIYKLKRSSLAAAADALQPATDLVHS